MMRLNHNEKGFWKENRPRTSNGCVKLVRQTEETQLSYLGAHLLGK